MIAGLPRTAGSHFFIVAADLHVRLPGQAARSTTPKYLRSLTAPPKRAGFLGVASDDKDRASGNLATVNDGRSANYAWIALSLEDPFGISMSTASVDTDLPRSIVICTFSGSYET